MRLIQNQLIRNFWIAGILFPVANIFAFAQSEDRFALYMAYATLAAAVLMRWLELYRPAIPERVSGFQPLVRETISPIGLVAIGSLISGIFSFTAGVAQQDIISIVVGFAGFFFAVGNFCNAYSWATDIQKNHESPPVLKIVTNAAIYYGLGYGCIGWLAGGFDSVPSSITTIFGVGATTLSAIGIMLKLFYTPASPFVLVAIGTFINTLSGFLTGNIMGVLNNFFAMCGELNLAYVFHKAGIRAQPSGQWQVLEKASLFLDSLAERLARTF